MGQVQETANSQVEETAESQVEQTAESQVSDTAESQVESTSVIDQIGQLLSTPQTEEPEEGETSDESENTEEPKDSEESKDSQEPEKGKEQSEPVVDDSIIEQFPYLRSYYGKPLKQVAVAYGHLVRELTKAKMELSELKKSKTEVKLDEVPDPIEDPEGFKKWYAAEQQRIREEALQEAKLQAQPQVDWVGEVKKYLPPEADVNKVLNSFRNFNALRFYNEYGQIRPEIERFYNEHPEVLIEEIRNHYLLASQAEKNKMAIQNESNKKAYETVTKSLKKAKEHKEDLRSAQVNIVGRSQEMTPEEELLNSMFQKLKGG